MLSEKEAALLREELLCAKNPLFFHDDDADGLCSFLLFYRMIKEGKGIRVLTSPKLDHRLARKIEEHNPDKIFVFDIPVS